MKQWEIDRDVELLLTISEFSESIQERIRAYAKMGMTYEGFRNSWRDTLRKAGFEDHEIEYIAPWIETWADEVYSKVDKEKS
jgi:hypothetical protein